MKYFDSIMTGQLNQVSNKSTQSNELSDGDEPDLQQILIEEARQRRLNRKRLLKLKQAKSRRKPKFRKISVSHLLKEFNQQDTDYVVHSNTVNLLDIDKINGMFI